MYAFRFSLFSSFYTVAAVFCLSGQEILKQQFRGASLMFQWIIINSLIIFLLIEMRLSYLSFIVCCLAAECEKKAPRHCLKVSQICDSFWQLKAL